MILLYPLFTCVFAVVYGDLLILQKVTARWLMPAGLLFLISSTLLVVALSRKQPYMSALGLLLMALNLFSLDPIAGMLIRSLEDQYSDVSYEEVEPFDTVVVLGGGTGVTITGRPQLTMSGERLAVAARLYNLGLAKQLVVTGDVLIKRDLPYDGIYEQSVFLLKGMGIKEVESIRLLNGRNTAQEIQSLKEAPELWKDKRCGLITSALHLPRAMKLAEKAGVKLIPIPADYTQPGSEFQPMALVPYAEWSHYSSRALYEYLGMFIGR